MNILQNGPETICNLFCTEFETMYKHYQSIIPHPYKTYIFTLIIIFISSILQTRKENSQNTKRTWYDSTQIFPERVTLSIYVPPCTMTVQRCTGQHTQPCMAHWYIYSVQPQPQYSVCAHSDSYSYSMEDTVETGASDLEMEEDRYGTLIVTQLHIVIEDHESLIY